MDNFSHALIGVLLGRAAAPYVGTARGAIFAAILASNLPDIDFAWMPLFQDPKLAYLVHHRGHTHTLLVGLVEALAVAFACRRWWPEAKLLPLFLLSYLGVALHVGADGWNNYGVHPLWPVDPGWRYGDSIFIIEPWLWMSLGPLAFWEAGRGLRAVLGLIGAAVVGLITWGLGPSWALVWVLGLALLLGLQSRLTGVWVWRVPLLLWGAILSVFAIGSQAARREVEGSFDAQLPSESLIDVVRVPRPSSPWCWSVIAVSVGPGGSYHLRPGLISLHPEWTAAGDCGIRDDWERSLRLGPPDLSDSERLRWEGHWTRPTAELQRLARDCRVDAFLHFGRSVWWEEEGSLVHVGDLRYDFEPEEGFAELSFRTDQPAACMDLPPWRSAAVEQLLRRK